MNEVSRVISEKDQMGWGVSIEQYFKTGELALDLCRKALAETSPSRILDFPSGHGRVLRWFRHQWPESEIFAAEIDADALDFCEQAFDAKKILSQPDIEVLDLPSNIDLIWSGSLLTHFNEHMWDGFLSAAINCLRPDGVLVFTTHGRIAHMLAKRGDPVYGNLMNLERLCKRYSQVGFAYQDYDPAYPVYGLSLSSPSWVMRKIEKLSDVIVTDFVEAGWGHQDVIVLKKLPTSI